MIFLEDLRCKAEWCYGDTRPTTLLKALLTDGTFAMACYRLMAWSHRHHLAPLTMVCNKVNAVFGQCIIGRGATFGPGFVRLKTYAGVGHWASARMHRDALRFLLGVFARKDQPRREARTRRVPEKTRRM